MSFAPNKRNRARTATRPRTPTRTTKCAPTKRAPPPPAPSSSFAELFGLTSSSPTTDLFQGGLGPYIIQGYLQALDQSTKTNTATTKEPPKLLARQCTESNSIKVDCANTSGGRQEHYHLTDYAPKAFEYVRRLFHISEQQHLHSLQSMQGSGTQGQGKSGMLFFTTKDQQYVLKTLKSEELPVMLSLLPHYVAHLDRYRCSLLPKFFGLTTFTFPKGSVDQPKNQNKYILIIMENILRPKTLHSGWFSRQPKVHEIYDLKGSTKGRVVRKTKSRAVLGLNDGTQQSTKTIKATKATKATTRSDRAATAVKNNNTATTNTAPILKDLDCQRRLVMDPKRRQRFFTQLREDVNLLIRHNLMDYSLLMGISFHGGSGAYRRASTDLTNTNTYSSNEQQQQQQQQQHARMNTSSSTKGSKGNNVFGTNELETVGSTGIPLIAVVNRVYGTANTRMNELLPTESEGSGGGKYTLKCLFQGRSIVRERGQSPYITYHIEVIKETTIEGRFSNSIEKQTWFIYRRYSDFVNVRASLNFEMSVTGYSTVVSALPPKVWLGNFDASVLDVRQLKLQTWMNSLLQVFTSRILQTSLPLKIFLTKNADEPPLGMSRRTSGSSKGSGKKATGTFVHPAAKQSMRMARATDVDSGSRVTLFLGVIDILQCFNLKKRIESSIKGRMSHPLAVSATDAQSYGKRFVEYLSSVLPPK